MVQIFICSAEGELLSTTNETKNIRWIPITQLKSILDKNENKFYPMHITTLKKYLNLKLNK